ncbi:MAG: putative ABC transporter permease [Christensenellaceae bacterium]
MSAFMRELTIFGVIFFVGAFLGWVLEVFYRRFVSHRKEGKWINPGFLTGPYLPIYGFGLAGMYEMQNLLPRLFSNELAGTIVTLAVMVLSMTVIEYIGGIIFIKGMGIRLWDYSDQPGNIQGIICPLYSFFWGVIAVAYFFLVHPLVTKAIGWVVEHYEFVFFVGLFGGVFLVDFWHSVDASVRIRSFAKEHKIIVHWEELKLSVRSRTEAIKQKSHFLRFFRPVQSWKDTLTAYLAEQKEKYRLKKEEHDQRKKK